MGNAPATTPSVSSQQDHALVKAALDGSQEAFSQLMEKYRNPIHHHIYRMVRDKGQVDDLVQEICRRIADQHFEYPTKHGEL